MHAGELIRVTLNTGEMNGSGFGGQVGRFYLEKAPCRALPAAPLTPSHGHTHRTAHAYAIVMHKAAPQVTDCVLVNTVAPLHEPPAGAAATRLTPFHG